MYEVKKMKTHKILKSIFLITALSLSIYYGLTLNKINIIEENEIIETSGNGYAQSMGVMLIIENERNGEILYRMEKEDDLILRSVAGIFHFMLKGNDAESSYLYKITTGASYSMVNNYGFGEPKSTIRIGTGTTPPAYEDWKLETEVYSDEIEAIGYTVSGLEMNATSLATFNILDTHAITEAGISVNYYTLFDCLLFRDVFSAINVIPGDILTVKYIVMWN